MQNEQKIKEAMQTLKDAGYFVDNLWSIQDVQNFYNASTEQAQRVLFNVFTNEHMVEYIYQDIVSEAQQLELSENYKY
jgi:hypothetical protein